MRTAAEVDEFAVAIKADLGAGRGELRDEVRLHEVAVAFKFFQGLFARLVFADEGLVARDDLGHFGFDGGEVFRREGFLAVEVVEEAGVGGGAVAELGLGKSSRTAVASTCAAEWRRTFSASGSFSVTSSSLMSEASGAERSTRRGAAASSAAYIEASPTSSSASGDWPSGDFGSGRGDRRDARGDTGCGQARRDGVGDIERRCAGRHFADGPVGQVYGDHVRAHMRDGNLVTAAG